MHRGIGSVFAAVHIVNDTGLPYTGHSGAVTRQCNKQSGENPLEQ